MKDVAVMGRPFRSMAKHWKPVRPILIGAMLVAAAGVPGLVTVARAADFVREAASEGDDEAEFIPASVGDAIGMAGIDDAATYGVQAIPGPQQRFARGAGFPRGWDGVEALFSVLPDVETCRPGEIRPAAKAEFLERLNRLRSLHGLGPVTYDASAEREAAETALVMAANGDLAHEVSTRWRCWSPLAAVGARTSNLAGGVVSRWLELPGADDELANWLRENNADDIGHRRWLLSPFLTRIAYGRAAQVLRDGRRTDAASVKVFGYRGEGRATGPVPPFVAYPFGAYPTTFFHPGDVLSFSVLARTDDAMANDGVDFRNARISVSDGARELPIREQASDNEPYGVANCLAWRVVGLVTGQVYHVTISNVRGAPSRTYRYDFEIKPDQTRLAER